LKASPNLNFTVIKPEQKSLNDFVQMLKTVYQNFIQVLNGNIGFGDGTIPDNISGSWINVVAPVAPNTDFTVNHNLQRLPVGYWVMQKDRACDVYTGSVAATTTQLTLRATVASAVLRLFIIGILLGLFSASSYAQGAGHRDIALVSVNTSAGSGMVKIVPSAVITVCNGTTLPPDGSACTGAASIFSNVALTLPLPNPTNADAKGNYVFFAAAGQNYVVSVGGVGVSTYSYIWTAPIISSGALIVSSLSSTSANPALTGFIRMASVDTIDWRNNTNTADILLGKNVSDSLTYAGNAFLDSIGNFRIEAFNSGAGASSSTFWRGDGTWAAPISIAASVNLTGQGANIGGTTLFTPGVNGFYRISCYTVVTQAATTSSTLPSCLLFSYGDADTSATETNFALTAISTCNAVGCGPPSSSSSPVASGSYTFNAKGGVAIQYATANYASVGGTSMQYAIHLRLEGPF